MSASTESSSAKEVRCPKCFSLDIVTSIPRGLVDWFFQQAQRVPVMCRFCGKKFYLPPGRNL